jgi:hypothetical protein
MTSNAGHEQNFMSPICFRMPGEDATYDSANPTATEETQSYSQMSASGALADDAFDEDDLMPQASGSPAETVSLRTNLNVDSNAGVDLEIGDGGDNCTAAEPDLASFLWNLSSERDHHETAASLPSTGAAVPDECMFQTPRQSCSSVSYLAAGPGVTVDIRTTNVTTPGVSPALDPLLRNAVLESCPNAVSVRMVDPFGPSGAEIVAFGSAEPLSAAEVAILQGFVPQPQSHIPSVVDPAHEPFVRNNQASASRNRVIQG